MGIRKLYYIDGGVCYLCEKPIKFISQASADHVIPLSRGGPNHPSNKRLAHKSCNNDKGDRLLEELDLDSFKRK
jgi:5-methylcytosine-specific restriction endonuclease McrA